VVPDVPARPDLPWVSSEVAGLFLLAGLLDRLGWPDRIACWGPAAAQGQRAVSYVLAGLALAVTGRSASSPQHLDPGLTLFAGLFDGPDLGGLRRFAASITAADCRELLRGLCGPNATEALTWDATLDALAGELLRAFAGRVRGFRQASRSFVVKHLVALPGRIRVEPERLLVVLAPQPFHVALRVAGLDGTMTSLGWLGGRDLTLELEGL
jgi:hypothetical protein